MSQIVRYIPNTGPGSGTVTSITAGTGITLTPNPIIAAGTVSLTIPVVIADGGTNAIAMANTFGVNYFDGTRIVTTAVGTAAQVLTSNGAGVAPTYQALPASGVVNIAGDTGTATGTTITFHANTNAGGSVLFNASGSTVDLAVTNARSCTFVGSGSGSLASLSQFSTAFGKLSLSSIGNLGHRNCAFGYQSLTKLVSSANNVAVGYNSMSTTVTGASNCAIGFQSLGQFNGGSGNVCLGAFSGFDYTSLESNNILLGNNVVGIVGESGITRIGDPASQTAAYIAGIAGVTVANTNMVTIDTATGQLGSAAVPSAGIATIDGDTGTGATGSTITFNGLVSGGTLSFDATGSTVTFNAVDALESICIGNSTPAPNVAGQNTIMGNLSGAATAAGGGGNSFFGYSCGGAITTGTGSVAIGALSGSAWTGTESYNVYLGSVVTAGAGESNTLRIGDATGTSPYQLNAAYIAGINGITVTGTAVLVSATDQLGIAVSSRRFKDNINDMGALSEGIYKLRPVSFNYNVGEDRSLQTGLIAEEVNEIMPALVVYDKSGEPQTVKYHDLPALLLNEVQKLRKELDELKRSK